MRVRVRAEEAGVDSLRVIRLKPWVTADQRKKVEEAARLADQAEKLTREARLPLTTSSMEITRALSTARDLLRSLLVQ